MSGSKDSSPETGFSKLMKMISPKFNKKSSGANTATAGAGKKSSGYSMFGGFMNQKKDKRNDVELSDSRDFNRAMSEYCS